MKCLFRISGLIWFAFSATTPLAAEDNGSGISLESRYAEVVDAYEKILASRVLQTADGQVLRYSRMKYFDGFGYYVDYSITFPNNSKDLAREVIWTDGSEVYVDQVVGDVITRRYLARIVETLKSLRLTPADNDNDGFISRECIRRSDREGTVCYRKVRFQNDVIVTTFVEKKNQLNISAH